MDGDFHVPAAVRFRKCGCIPRSRFRGFGRQFATFFCRELETVVRDRVGLVMATLLPLALGGIVLAGFSDIRFRDPLMVTRFLDPGEKDVLADVWGEVSKAIATERDLRRLTADIQTTVVEENLAFLQNVRHPDYVHTRPNGVVSDRARCLARVKQDEAELNVNHDELTSTNVAVRVYDDTAILTGRSGIVSKDASGALTDETRWTRIFLRQNGRWKLVAFQATLVPKK